MSAHGQTGEIKNPGPYQVSGALKGALIFCVVLGTVAFLGGLNVDASRAWSGFVMGHFYFLLLGLGGLFFAGLQWLTNAMWSAPVRRLAESFTSYLPVLLASCVVLFLGIHSIYHWSHQDVVASDVVLQGKSGYLNTSFFVIRNVVAVLIWIFFSYKLIGNSLAQDRDGDFKYTAQNRSLTPVFTILFALTLTMVSFDQIMSLDPHWFSTIFGIYCFAGLFGSTLALLCLMSIFFRRSGVLKDVINENHLHDLGKFMFAFTIFWAYIGFSQFMLIWYANLPEETTYFLKRSQEGWKPWMAILFVVKFVIPFFVLMPRANKRRESVLIFVAVLMLIGQYLDLIWMVQPEFHASGPKIGWIEIGTFLGFLGLFGLCVARFLGRHNILAIGDPKLKEAVFHHHQ